MLSFGQPLSEEWPPIGEEIDAIIVVTKRGNGKSSMLGMSKPVVSTGEGIRSLTIEWTGKLESASPSISSDGSKIAFYSGA